MNFRTLVPRNPAAANSLPLAYNTWHQSPGVRWSHSRPALLRGRRGGATEVLRRRRGAGGEEEASAKSTDWMAAAAAAAEKHQHRRGKEFIDYDEELDIEEDQKDDPKDS